MFARRPTTAAQLAPSASAPSGPPTPRAASCRPLVRSCHLGQSRGGALPRAVRSRCPYTPVLAPSRAAAVPVPSPRLVAPSSLPALVHPFSCRPLTWSCRHQRRRQRDMMLATTTQSWPMKTRRQRQTHPTVMSVNFCSKPFLVSRCTYMFIECILFI